MIQATEPNLERWNKSYTGRLQWKLLAVVLPLLIVFSLLIYAISVPMINDRIYKIEQEASLNILKTVSEIADHIHIGIDSHRKQILAGHKRELETVINLIDANLEGFRKKMNVGSLTRDEAREQILGELSRFKYGQDGYIWVANYDSKVLSHPDPDLHHKVMSDWRDENGKLIMPQMIDIAMKDGEGFFQYQWSNMGEDQLRDKISYFRNFPEWGFVVGTGVYLDEVEQEVQQRKQEAIADLRQALRDVHVSKTGYIFVFDADLHLIIHPNPVLENSFIQEVMIPGTQKPIYEELVKWADKPEGFRYKWDHPDDRGNFNYDKISFIRYMKELDWYIVSTVYEDELRSGADQLSNRFLTISLIILVVCILLGWIFIRWLTAPIHRLARTAARIRAGDLHAQSAIDRDDELGLLSQAFDEMVEKLRTNINSLDWKVKERTKELEATNQRLVEAQRLQAVGQLSGGLAHDFNNLLSVILGNLLPIQERPPKPENLPDYIEPAIRSARRGADITSRLLAFSRRQILRPSHISVFQTAEDVVVLLGHSLPSNIDMHLENRADGSSTYVDAAQLENALINLGLNARDAMPKGGRLSIVIDAASLSGELGYDDEIAEGRYIKIHVQDEGSGFAPDVMEHAFEPFFTTKQTGAGSGLGLSMVFGFIKQSNGYVRLTNNENGKGACISLLLPVLEKRADKYEDIEAAAEDAKMQDLDAIGASRLALLVEDEKDVRAVLLRQLVELGFSVLEASDVDEAMTLLGSVKDISLIVSDVMMPGSKSGHDLARYVADVCPDVAMILMSGYAFDEENIGHKTRILRKPIEKCQLKQAIMTHLDQ